MEHRLLRRTLLVLVVMCLVLASTTASHAASVTLNLARTSALTNAADAGGTWLFDGGTVSFGGAVVGRYARVMRTVLGGGTDTQNTAILTITLFFNGANPPENVTLQGSHSFNDGEERGSISGASNAFRGAAGITFEGTATGSTTFNLTFQTP
jgi:hypothetical protein